jgi:hypothetical protein
MQGRTTCPTQFGVCTDNRGYPAFLEVGKLYHLVPDSEAAKHGYLRVVDESGEDYAYSANITCRDACISRSAEAIVAILTAHVSGRRY